MFIRFCQLGIFLLATIITGCSDRGTQYQGYIEGEYIYLASGFSGTLQQLAISRGQTVAKGQLLFVLDPQPEAAELAKARQDFASEASNLKDLEQGQRKTVIAGIVAQINQAKANLQFSTVTLQRYRTLYKQKAIAKSSLDQAQSDYQHDLDLVNQYQANLAEAQQGARTYQVRAQQNTTHGAQADVVKAVWQLQQKQVRAPTAGMIFDTYYKVGEFVSTPQPVAALLAPENTYLIFYIPEPQRGHLKLGQKLTFTCDGCTMTGTATINYISPQAEYTPPVIYSRESRSKLVYRVQAALPLDVAQRFYPGQPVDVYVHF
ncbi:MAG: HlyD family efflux transporter periplasmic adaptor subunit [Gammaproteobacteria bacterium]